MASTVPPFESETPFGKLEHPIASRARNFAINLLIGWCALVIAQFLTTPAHPSLAIPFHSDLWRYYAFSHDQSLYEIIRSPRPLMLVYLYVLRFINDPSLFFIALNVPATVFVAVLAMELAELWHVNLSWVYVFAFSVLVFTTSSFLELNPLDYGGMLAGGMMVYAIYWLRTRVSEVGVHGFPTTVAVYGILSLISVETKPTFAFILVALPLLWYSVVPKKKIVFLVGVACLALVISAGKDIIIGSPFIRLGAHTGPYAITHNPISSLLAVWSYVARMMPLWWIPLWVCTILLTARYRGMRLAVAMVGAPVLAVAPMGLIPDRVMSMYAWYGTAILAGTMVCATQLITWRSKPIVSPLLVLLLFTPLVFSSPQDRATKGWVSANREFNRMALSGMNALYDRVQPGDRVLIVGDWMPYNPFHDDDFVRMLSPVPFTYKVIYPASYDQFAKMNHDSTLFEPFDSLNVNDFRHVAVFSAAGQLERFEPIDKVAGMTIADRAAVFFCGDKLAVRDVGSRASGVMDCLNEHHEFKASIGYGDEVPTSQWNQWTWFMFGRANESLGNFSSAYQAYSKAHSIEPAKTFEAAMVRTKEKLGNP